MSLPRLFDTLLEELKQQCLSCYGESLVSLAVFGSVARGTMGRDSDIDLLVVIDGAPAGRMRRLAAFERVEDGLDPSLRAATRESVHTALSPVIKTREEVLTGSPLFLDMVDRSRVLFDRDGFLRGYLEDLGRRLQALGARRIYRGGGYYWLLKPDLKPGETVPL